LRLAGTATAVCGTRPRSAAVADVKTTRISAAAEEEEEDEADEDAAAASPGAAKEDDEEEEDEEREASSISAAGVGPLARRVRRVAAERHARAARTSRLTTGEDAEAVARAWSLWRARRAHFAAAQPLPRVW
jgi:hypothetical protein